MTKILIVDDVDYIRTSICRVLEANGFECDVCENGQKAMQMLNENTYDLVITDIMMPEVDGYELLDYLRDHHTADVRIPVLAISGGDKTINSDIALDVIRGKADAVLQKPFAKADLMKAITRVMSHENYGRAII